MKVFLVVFVAWSFAVRASAQSEFDKANELLRTMQSHRLASRTSEDRDRVGIEVNLTLPAVGDLLTNAILKSLNANSQPQAEELARRIKAALQVGPAEPGNEAEAFVLPFGNSPTPLYVVAYNIAFCAVCTRSWLGAFGRKDGRYSLIAMDPNFLPNQSITVVPLMIGGSNEVRFLVYGTLWGDTRNRLNAVAYRFDGHALKEVWSRIGLPRGSLEIKARTIILSYLVDPRSPQDEKRETYLVTPTSIELQKESNTP